MYQHNMMKFPNKSNRILIEEFTIDTKVKDSKIIQVSRLLFKICLET